MRYPELSRRELLKAAAQAGAVLALPAMVPGKVLGKNGAVPPSEKIVAGGIGLRGRGMGDLQWMMGQPDVQFVAVCEVRKSQREAIKNVVGNLGHDLGLRHRPGAQHDRGGCGEVNDGRRVLKIPPIAPWETRVFTSSKSV